MFFITIRDYLISRRKETNHLLELLENWVQVSPNIAMDLIIMVIDSHMDNGAYPLSLNIYSFLLRVKFYGKIPEEYVLDLARSAIAYKDPAAIRFAKKMLLTGKMPT